MLPPALAAVCLSARSVGVILIAVSAGGVAWAALAGGVAWVAFLRGPLEASSGWLYLDALSAYHAVVLGLIFGASSIYAWGYFRQEIEERFRSARALRSGKNH
jgi:formate hydrogenlyase subunit 3/multisubunit Na+/H+ antiporter MnhD subunit